MSSGHVFVVTRVASDSMKRGFLICGVCEPSMLNELDECCEFNELCVSCELCALCELNELCVPCELCVRIKSRVWNPSGAMSMIMHRRKYFRWPWSSVEIMNMKRGMNGKWFMILSIIKSGSCWDMRLVYAS